MSFSKSSLSNGSNESLTESPNEILILNKYRRYLRRIKDLPPWMNFRSNGNSISSLEWYVVDEDFPFSVGDESVINFILNKLYSLSNSVVTHKLTMIDGDVCISFTLMDSSTFYVKYSRDTLYVIEGSVVNSEHYKNVMDVLLKCIDRFNFSALELIA